MSERWVNWSGGIDFRPARIVRAGTVEEVSAAVREGPAPVRSVGSGHSSSPLVETPGTLVSLEHLTGLRSLDPEAGEAVFGAGTTLDKVGPLLAAEGFAMENLGDVDMQALAGAFGTGTHGSGDRFPHLGDQLTGFRMVTASGEVLECSESEDPDVLRAARLGLGLLGIFTELRIRIIPTGRYIRREWCVSTEDCIANLDALITRNRNFDFYWYPRRDDAHLRTHNPIDDDPGMIVPGELRLERDGPLDELLASEQQLKFHEMEYWLPFEDGIDCFQEVRRRMKEHHRRSVAWRVLVRVIAEDDAFLSPAYKRRSIAITLHQNASLPYEDFFADVEQIFQRFGGRPHWAKVHSLKGPALRSLYPEFDAFEAIRARMDPAGRFLNDYLRQTFGPN